MSTKICHSRKTCSWLTSGRFICAHLLNDFLWIYGTLPPRDRPGVKALLFDLKKIQPSDSSQEQIHEVELWHLRYTGAWKTLVRNCRIGVSCLTYPAQSHPATWVKSCFQPGRALITPAKSQWVWLIQISPQRAWIALLLMADGLASAYLKPQHDNAGEWWPRVCGFDSFTWNNLCWFYSGANPNDTIWSFHFCPRGTMFVEL